MRRQPGFFYVTGHGVSPGLQQRLMATHEAFFALPAEAKRAYAMEKGGKAWRGYFSVGEELTRCGGGGGSFGGGTHANSHTQDHIQIP